jgi:hypothetical protein
MGPMGSGEARRQDGPEVDEIKNPEEGSKL